MHSQYRRMVPGASKALLFVHGILGTPRHFDALVALVPEDTSVFNLLLDGHGKGVRDFSRTSMAKWEAQVREAVWELARTHERIYVVAHSMGCLLTMEAALREPKIAGMFLLAAPLKLFLRPQMVTNSMKVYLDRVAPDDGPGMAAKGCCGITHSRNFLLYLGWVPRFLELFRKIRDTRNLLPDLAIPCFACQSAKDEMVSIRSSEILQSNPHISVTDLPHSGHFYYPAEDQDLLMQAFSEFIRLP